MHSVYLILSCHESLIKVTVPVVGASWNMKVSFSLSKAKAAKPVGDAPTLKKPVAFASIEDDEPLDASATAESSTRATANRQLVAQNVQLSKQMKKRLEEEKKVDATVFEYDEVWDKMQEAKLRQKEEKEADSKERKVRDAEHSLDDIDNMYSPSTLADCCLPLPLDDWITCERKRR